MLGSQLGTRISRGDQPRHRSRSAFAQVARDRTSGLMPCAFVGRERARTRDTSRTWPVEKIPAVLHRLPGQLVLRRCRDRACEALAAQPCGVRVEAQTPDKSSRIKPGLAPGITFPGSGSAAVRLGPPGAMLAPDLKVMKADGWGASRWPRPVSIFW